MQTNEKTNRENKEGWLKTWNWSCRIEYGLEGSGGERREDGLLIFCCKLMVGLSLVFSLN